MGDIFYCVLVLALLLLAHVSISNVDLNDRETVNRIVATFNEEVAKNFSACTSDGSGWSLFEKVTARSRYDRRAILPIVADKRLLHDFARSRSLPMAPLLHAGSNCDALPKLAELPQNFAFKSSHNSGCNMLVIAGKVSRHNRCMGEEDMTGKNVNDVALQQYCLAWISQRYAGSSREWAYSVMPRSVVIEELLTRNSNPSLANLADDLKCYDFNGQTAYVVQVSQRYLGDGKTDTYYEPDGTPRPDISQWVMRGPGQWEWTHPLAPGQYLEPAVIQQAADFCQRAGKGFDYTRVDLLRDAKGSLYLGEMTLYSAPEWRPAEVGKALSKRWCLSERFVRRSMDM